MKIAGAAALPFETFYASLLAGARERLARDAGDALSSLAPAALASCERALLTRLARLGFLALDFEYSLWRGERQLATLLAGPAGAMAAPLQPVDELERNFTAQMTSLDKYPVLARLLS